MAASENYWRVPGTRTNEEDPLSGVIQAGELEISPGEGLAKANDHVLNFSVREFGVLVELARSDGRILRREELYEEVWGSPLRPGDRTIDVYVRRIRVKLADVLPTWSFIHTHVGFGYRFAPEPALAPAEGGSQGVHNNLTGP